MQEMDASGTDCVTSTVQAAARKIGRRARNWRSGLNPDIEPVRPADMLFAAVKNKDRSFHFVPYHFDSSFELAFLKKPDSEILQKRGWNCISTARAN